MSPAAAAVVLGMLLQNLCWAHLCTHMCSVPSLPTIAIKTPALGRSVGYMCMCTAKSDSYFRCAVTDCHCWWVAHYPAQLPPCVQRPPCGLHSVLHFSWPLCEGCIITRRHSFGRKLIVWNYIDTLYTLKCATGLNIVRRVLVTLWRNTLVILSTNSVFL